MLNDVSVNNSAKKESNVLTLTEGLTQLLKRLRAMVKQKLLTPQEADEILKQKLKTLIK